MSGYTHDGVQINPILSGRWKKRVEPLAVTLTPRFVTNQVVVTLAIGRECFAPDGVTLLATAAARERVAAAVEDAMRALQEVGPNG